MTELLPSRGKTFMDEELLPYGWAKNIMKSTQMKSTPGEDAINSVEMTAKDLEYCINLVDDAVADFEKIDSNCERSSLGTMLSYCIACCRKIVCESINVANFIVLRNCHTHPSFQQLPPWSVSYYQHQGKTLHQQKDYNSLKALMMISIF